MARSKQFNTSVHYFPARLTERLEGTLTANTTVIEAPSGYGKTTAVRDYLTEVRLPETGALMWHVCLEEPAVSAWKRFCRCVQTIDSSVGDELLLIGLPDEDTIADVVAALWDIECETETWMVLDDFQYIKNAVPHPVWQAMIHHRTEAFHIVILTQLMDDAMLSVGNKPEVLYLDSNDLRLTQEECREYFAKVGVSLTLQEMREVYRRTEGWMIALYMQMLHYLSTGGFTAALGIRTLIRETVWNRFSAQEQAFLLTVSPFDGYTLRQAGWLMERQLPLWARQLSERNPFIRYDPTSRFFYLHSMLLEFVREEFDALEDDRQQKILCRAAEWCVENQQILQAVTLLYRLGDITKILMLDCLCSDIAQADGDDYLTILLDIAEHVTPEMMLHHPNAMIKLIFELFGAGGYEQFGRLCGQMEEVIGKAQLPKKEKERICGELILLASFGEYNDIEKMSAGQRQASRLMGGRPSVIHMTDCWTFGNVSVLMMYHAKTGKLDEELASMKECLPYYIRLTKGHGKGADILMQAEALFCRGEAEEAEILAHKAWYQAELAGQTSVYIGAALLLARLAIYQANAAEFFSVRERMYQQAESDGQKCSRMEADMAYSFLMGLLGAPQEMAEWLRQGDISEKRLLAMAIPHAQVLFGQYLVTTGNPEIWLGMADDAQELAETFHYPLASVYQWIYSAAAWSMRHHREKARSAMGEALALALPDRLYMPFAEHYELVGSLLEDCCPQEPLACISALAHQQRQGREAVLAALHPLPDSHGLTEREHDVAQLAAEGLSNPEIAEKLYISRNTVKGYLKQIYEKLGIISRTELKKIYASH